MAITTYNQAPYHDDYQTLVNGRSAENKNYLRILFRPGFALQARELNSLQSSLQTQIDRHGSGSYRNGQPVLDGKAIFKENVLYVDLIPSEPFTTSTLVTSLLLQDTIEIVTGTDGEAGNELFVKPIGANIVGTKVRLFFETIFESSDSPTVTIGKKIPANATVRYKGDSQIIDSSGNTQENDSVIAVVGNTTDSGYGFGVTVDAGIYYIKGQFVHTPAIRRFWIKENYDDIVRGDTNLIIREKIITSTQDGSLLDNAGGTANYSAPGADRYQITLDVGFFEPVLKFGELQGQSGNIFIKGSRQDFTTARLFTTSEESVELEENNYDLGKKNLDERLATRTVEESGDYTLNPFGLSIREFVDTTGEAEDALYQQSEITSDQPFGVTTVADGEKKFIAEIENGTAYVGGYRFYFPQKTTLAVDKARTFKNVEDEEVTFQIGNYIEIDVFDSPKLNSPTRTDDSNNPSAIKNVYATSTGTRINNINELFFNPNSQNSSYSPANQGLKSIIKSAIYLSDTADAANGNSTYKYRFYLSHGASLADIKSAIPGIKDIGNYTKLAAGVNNSSNGIAIQDRANDGNVFLLPKVPVRNVGAVTYEKFRRFPTTGANAFTETTFTSSSPRATITITAPSGETFTGTGANDKFDYTIIRRQGLESPYNYRLINPENYELISGTSSSVTFGAVRDDDSPLFGDSPTAADGKWIVYAPVKITTGKPRTKTRVSGETDIRLQLRSETGNFIASPNLVVKLKDQDVIASTITNPFVTNFTVVDNGQSHPEFYNDVKLQFSSEAIDFGSSPTLGNTPNFKFTYDYYEHSEDGDYFTVNSYGNYDDDTVTQAIPYASIPKYEGLSLSNYIDFRSKSNRESPRNGSEYGNISLVPNRPVKMSYSYYLPRRDRLVIDQTGKIRMITGQPDNKPVLPEQPEGALTLYTTFIPPFTGDVNRILTQYVDNSRFTMRDIGRLKKRVDEVEYYTALSLLESNLNNKQITNDDGTERFKNGFLVSNFERDTISNPLDSNYLACIDRKRSLLRPYFTQRNLRLFYEFPAESNASQREATEENGGIAKVKDYYDNSPVNDKQYDVVRNTSVPKSGRPLTLLLGGFNPNVQDADGNDANGYYRIYRYHRASKTRRVPEYRPVWYLPGKGGTFRTNIGMGGQRRRMFPDMKNNKWEIQFYGPNGWETKYTSKIKSAYPASYKVAGFSNIDFVDENGIEQNAANSGSGETSFVEITQDDIQDNYAVETETPASGANASKSAAETNAIIKNGQNGDDMLTLWNGDATTGPSAGREVFVEQIAASRTESVQPFEVATWEGHLKLSPSGDEWVDTDRRPARVIQDDTALTVLQFLEDNTDVFEGVLGTDWGTFETVSSTDTVIERRIDTFTERVGQANRWRTFESGINITDTVQTTVDFLRQGVETSIGAGLNLETSLGDAVTDINIVPFIRSRDISLYASGLKPNTRVYVFFDGKDVSRYVAAASRYNKYSRNTSVATFNGAGEPTSIAGGGAISSNRINHYAVPLFTTAETGEFFGTLRIPNNNSLRFRTGSKSVRITSSKTNNLDDVDTFAETTYTARGLRQTVEEKIIATRQPQIQTRQVQQTRRVTQRSTAVTRQVQRRWSQRYDPVAQTFKIGNQYPQGIFLSDVDVFFAEKPSYIADVEVYITTVENGIPTQTVVPGSRVNKPYTLVNVPAGGRETLNSDDILSSATNFKFEYPIYLKPGLEYALVVFSKSVDYRVWVAEFAGRNIINGGAPITSQADSGVFLKSSNASTWTPDQTKDLMFRLRKCLFKQSHTATFQTQATNVNGTVNNQGVGDIAQDLKFSAFSLETETITLPGTRITYAVDFLQPGGNVLVNSQYGVPDTISSGEIIELDKEIITTSNNPNNVVNNIRIRATLSNDEETVRDDGFYDISPIIDLEKLSIVLYKNILQQSVANRVTLGEGDLQTVRNNQNGFITKKVKLVNSADNLRVFLLTNRLSSSSNIEVYAKVKSSTQDSPFDNLDWQPMTVRANNEGVLRSLSTVATEIPINRGYNDYSETEFNFSPSADIIEYALKIAFTGTDSGKIVKVKDLRSIATS